MKRKTLLVTSFILASLVIVGPLTSTAGADDTALAQAWIAAWNSHDADAVADLFTNDAVFEELPFGIVKHGPAEIRELAQFWFTVFPDFKLEAVNSTLKGQHATVEWILSATDVGLYRTGKQISGRGVSVIDLHGRKIARQSEYYDLAGILREIGLLPPGL
jgi:steroid delta-isomerase-like uncharacterized protein